MDQYLNNKSNSKSTNYTAADDMTINKKMMAMQAHLERQDKLIQDLEKEIKKVKNEVRIAINAYNLKHGK